MPGRPSPMHDVDPPRVQVIRYALTTRQVAELRRAAQGLGISGSELLRRLLDQWIGQRHPRFDR